MKEKTGLHKPPTTQYSLISENHCGTGGQAVTLAFAMDRAIIRGDKRREKVHRRRL